MEKMLSRLSRKPSGISEQEMKAGGWYEAREKVFNHMENDPMLQKLIDKFRIVDDKIKMVRSTRDMKINFHTMENSRGHRYVYARTQFVLDGKRKDFRKYLGREAEVNIKTVNLSSLQKYFLDMLQNFLEYQN